MKKILLIGKRGFLGNYLNKYLKEQFKIKFISFKEIGKIKKTIIKYDFIINTSINKNYIKNKYNKKFDNDLQISNILSPRNTFIFLSSRKVYKSKDNIKESDKLKPLSNYAKNKIITEKFLRNPINLPTKPKVASKRIKIGYVSSDFCNFPTMHLLVGVLEAHNRERFEIYAFSYALRQNDKNDKFLP